MPPDQRARHHAEHRWAASEGRPALGAAGRGPRPRRAAQVRLARLPIRGRREHRPGAVRPRDRHSRVGGGCEGSRCNTRPRASGTRGGSPAAPAGGRRRPSDVCGGAAGGPMRPQGDANGAGCAANLPCLRRAGAAAGAALRRGVRVALLLPVPQGAPLARVRKGACPPSRAPPSACAR